MANFKKSFREKLVDLMIVAAMWIVILVTLYPFIYVLSMSISEPIYVISKAVWLYPKGFSLGSYKMVFENPDIWTAYYNTLFYTIAGTLLNITMTVLGAYPLSRRSFVARKPFMIFIIITMFFNGGIIPSFLLVKNLGIYNTRLAVLLPVAVSAFLIIITRTFFENIPESMHESAKIEGAGELTILLRIILPLSKPIISVLALFYAVSHWNSYFSALLYLPNPKLQPVSMYLVKVLVQSSNAMLEGMADEFERAIYAIQIRYALIIVVVLPILAVYPFLQKYFVKGVMVGSVKE